MLHRSPDPYDSSASLPKYNKVCNITPFGSAKKQPLNHDQAIKRAKIQLTGKGDIFVFYNQPMNGMD
jgi:hypothetical protein